MLAKGSKQRAFWWRLMGASTVYVLVWWLAHQNAWFNDGADASPSIEEGGPKRKNTKKKKIPKN